MAVRHEFSNDHSPSPRSGAGPGGLRTFGLRRKVRASRGRHRRDKGGMRARTDFVDRDVESCRWLSFAEGPQGVEEAFFAVQLIKA